MEKVMKNPEPDSLAESLAGDGGACPIPLTHDRLDEIHYWWHEMGRNYHEPDRFRYSLGAFVQAARSVTFMLQKEKHVFVDFTWYQSWVEMATKDFAMSWLQSARTNVVHREALIPGSTLELRCLGDPRHAHGKDDDPTRIRVSPFQCTHYYIHTTLFSLSRMFSDHAHEFERRWSMEGLNGRELLEVCADCFDRLVELVHFAHQQLGVSMGSSRREGSSRSLPCMEDTTPHRVARTIMQDGHEIWVNEPPGLHNE
jgi:hypothetical protein